MGNRPDARQIGFCFLLGVIALAVAMGIGRFAFTPILPLMIQEGKVALAQTALLSSSNYIGYLVGALLLLKSKRHPLFVMLGLGLVTVTTWLASISAFGLLIILRFLAGMASAWVLVSISAWAVPWLKSRHVASPGLIYTGVGLGITLTGLLCSYFIYQAHTTATNSLSVSAVLTASLSSQLWQYLGGIAFAATMLVVWLFRVILATSTSSSVNATTQPNQSGASTQIQAPPAVPKLRLVNVLLAYGLFGFGYILPATFLPQIAKQWLSGNSYLLIWPFFGLAAALSVALSLWLQQRYRSLSLLRVWQVAQVIMAVGTLLPAFWQSLPALLLSALMVGGTFMVVTMAGLQVAASQMTYYPNYNLSALMTASFAFGQLIGPLTALISTTGNIWVLLLPFSAVVLMVGVALLLYANQRASA